MYITSNVPTNSFRMQDSCVIFAVFKHYKLHFCQKSTLSTSKQNSNLSAIMSDASKIFYAEITNYHMVVTVTPLVPKNSRAFSLTVFVSLHFFIIQRCGEDLVTKFVNLLPLNFFTSHENRDGHQVGHYHVGYSSCFFNFSCKSIFYSAL